GYNLTVEMDGKTHKIWVTNWDMTAALDTLVDRLKELTTDTFCRGLIGLELGEAQRRITAAGYTVRVLSIDGVHFPRTDDWRPNRINLTVKKGKVVGAHIG